MKLLEKKKGKMAPVSITRISPLKIGTLVSTQPVRIRRDFGTMARGEGDPVPFTHQFYKAHLKAPVSVDLSCAGTFFVSKRVGFKNLDSHRTTAAETAGAVKITVRGLEAFRLPIATRQQRVVQLVSALGRLEGGAKQTLHLTDTAPSILILAVCKSGNQPFMRVVGPDDVEESTVFRADALTEVLTVFNDDIVSDVFVGWTKGFLDAQRCKLEEAIRRAAKLGEEEKAGPSAEAPSPGGQAKQKEAAKLDESLESLAKVIHATKRTIHLKHPREIADDIAQALQDSANAAWFD